jgi:hypothetical protein
VPTEVHWLGASAPRPARWSFRGELLVAFLIGVTLIQFLFSGTGGRSGVRPNLAGNDCFYHVKMALMLPEIGLPPRFEWLTQTIFFDRFVSHHYGFHVYLLPFVKVSQWLVGDPIPGARWAMAVSFGLVLAVFVWVLRTLGITSRWVWLTLVLLAPTDFFIRHCYVRAIDLSLLLQLVGLGLLLRGRYALAGLVIALYTHVYLGSFFLIIIAGIHFVSGLLDRERPRIDGRLLAWVVAGTVAGVMTHPYFPDSVSFLGTQIFATGLTPEIGVGTEWRAYDNVWSFANLIGIPLAVQAVALAWRLRAGPPLNRGEWTLLVASLFFFVLVLKARRFIEYWPVFSVLSSAALAGGLVDGVVRSMSVSGPSPRAGGGRGAVLCCLATALIAASGTLVVLTIARRAGLGASIATWRSWDVSWIALLVLMVLAVALPALLDRGGRLHSSLVTKPAVAVQILMVGALVYMILLVGIAPQASIVRRWAKGKYDLDQVQAVMRALRDASDRGDIVFTDDWDVFPVYFFFNDWNRYIVGLDPVFSYRKDRETWERYVKISRGQVPSSAAVEDMVDGRRQQRTIQVTPDDIRAVFHARFVITDQDHTALSEKLDAASTFARRIYTATPRTEGAKPPYMLFEILAPASPAAPPPAAAAPGVTEPRR